MIVPSYDWHAFFQPYFKSFPGLKKIHHFRFSAEFPGMVFYKIKSDDTEKSFDLLRVKDKSLSLADLSEIKPPGLTLERQWYLHNKIREFVKPESQDITCPQPATVTVPSSVTMKLVSDVTVCQPGTSGVHHSSVANSSCKRKSDEPHNSHTELESEIAQPKSAAGHQKLISEVKQVKRVKQMKQTPKSAFKEHTELTDLATQTRTRQVRKPRKYTE